MLFVGPRGDVRLLSDCYVLSKEWHDENDMEYSTTRFYYPKDGAFKNNSWPGVAYEIKGNKFYGELQHIADYHYVQEYDITPLLSGEFDEFNFDLTEYIFESVKTQGDSCISKDLVINTGIAVITIKKELLLNFFNENQVKPTLRI